MRTTIFALFGPAPRRRAEALMAEDSSLHADLLRIVIPTRIPITADGAHPQNRSDQHRQARLMPWITHRHRMEIRQLSDEPDNGKRNP